MRAAGMDRSVDIAPASGIFRKAIEDLDEFAAVGIEGPANFELAIACSWGGEAHPRIAVIHDGGSDLKTGKIEAGVPLRIGTHDLRTKVHGRIGRRVGPVRVGKAG